MVAIADRFELTDESIAEFSRRWNVTELSVFGSVLREDFGPSSDVDMLIDFAPTARHTIFDVIRMEEELTRLIGRQVDLVEKRAIERSENPRRRRAILDSAKVVFDG